jgi:nicotinamide-nucleotide amidase
LVDAQIVNLATELGTQLLQHGCWVTTAESCTGGGIAHAITAASGSSSWFEMSYVTYSNRAKRLLLGVKEESLTQFGAVSECIVKEMAEGALVNSSADISVAVSGIAGPTGGSTDKPVGTVWFAWATKGGEIRTLRQHFSGDRDAVRDQTIIVALQGLLSLADKITGKSI